MRRDSRPWLPHGILAAGQQWGAGESRGERLLVEFVSPNPTGPLTAAGGRHAAYGDSLGRVLSRAGSPTSQASGLGA